MLRTGRNTKTCANGCGCGSRRVARARWLVILALVALALAAAPFVARPDDLVAEAVFVQDTLPPGGRDLNLSLGVAPVDEAEGGGVAVVPRLQLAYALGPRAGFTVDSGVALDGTHAPVPDSPTASLKLLLREAGADRTGLAASVDFIGAPPDWPGSELGIGLGAARAFGRVTFRAALWGMSAIRSFALHAHLGFSAAVQPHPRVRLLAEAVADVQRGGAVGLGPTVKVALSDATSLTGAVLVDVRGTPAFSSAVFQVGRSL